MPLKLSHVSDNLNHDELQACTRLETEDNLTLVSNCHHRLHVNSPVCYSSAYSESGIEMKLRQLKQKGIGIHVDNHSIWVGFIYS
jgi:hypothetical protein